MRTIVLGLVFVMCAQTARAATKTEVMVPMPDGTRLMTDVWRPNPAQFPGPRPVILRRTPYGRGFPFPQSLLVWNLAELLALPDAPDSLRCAHVQNASDNLYDSLMPGGAMLQLGKAALAHLRR